MIYFEKFIFPDLDNDMTDCSDRGAFLIILTHFI